MPGPPLRPRIQVGRPNPVRPTRPVAPGGPVVITPPARPAAPAAIPSGPAGVPPAGLDSKQLAVWVRDRLEEHETLRARSFWECGRLIGLLMPAKSALGVKDIKELVESAQLGISHFTAQKYVMVARSFEQELAVRQGIEKCYSLTVYAKAIGREGQAARILAGDETIQGSEGERGRALTAQRISGAQLRAAIRTLKKKAREEVVPSEVQLARAQLAEGTEKTLRDLGLKSPSARLVRRDGKTQIAIYVSLESAEALDSKLAPAMVKLIARLARKRPEVAALVRSAGLGRIRAPA